MKVITINNQKGGIAKTTLCIEMAYLAAEKGNKVLVMDFDPSYNLTNYIGAKLIDVKHRQYVNCTDEEIEEIERETKGNPRKMKNYNIKTVVDYLEDMEELENVVQTVRTFKKGRLDVIAGDGRLADPSKIFKEVGDDYMLFSQLCLDDAKEYDYIFIDIGPSKSILSKMVYTACDYVIVPTACDSGSQDGLLQVCIDLKALNALHEDENYVKKMVMEEMVPLLYRHQTKLLGVIYGYVKNAALMREFFEELKITAKDVGTNIFQTKINDAIAIRESRIFHLAVSEYAPKSKAAKQMKDLWKEIEKRIKEDAK